MNREVKQKRKEGKKEPFFQGENKVLWFIPAQTKAKQKQSKNKPQKQPRRI